ncbi:MAG: putative ABC transport system permease protein, partial [Dinoroseobacter sp.]
MIAWKIARRELRSGLQGFYVFLACLALGVAAIAAVGSVRVSIQEGLAREGAVILGGDASIAFTYRFAEEDELAWMTAQSEAVSEIVDFRSMVVVDRDGGPERGLTQVKGVDAAYPLKGSVGLEPEMSLANALAGSNGLPGIVAQRVLIDRLGLSLGDVVRLGTQEFVVMAALTREPDGAGSGFGLGPRSIVLTSDLANSSLLEPGTLFDSAYRLALPAGAALDALEAEAEAQFAESGLRWRDSRNGAPGISEFVDRIGAFLVLVGLAGLAVGGVGVSAAVRSYLDSKTGVIATLKTLGAEGRTIFAAYLIQIGILSLVGIALGLILGAVLPLIFAPIIEARLPIPAAFGVHPGPLFEAAIYGALTALVFTLWPLARTEQVRAAALFRDASGPVRAWPRARYIAAIGLALVALIGLATWFSGTWRLTLGATGGILGSLLLLTLSAWLVRRAARRLARSKLVRGRTSLRLALGAVGGPGGETTSVVLSLG